MADEKQDIQAEEQIVAVGAEENAADVDRSIKLSKPLNGQLTITFDFEKIKGSTLLRCEKKTKDVDNTVVVPQLSMIFQAHVAAAALGMRYDDIINLPAPDFMAITLRVSRFLNGAE